MADSVRHNIAKNLSALRHARGMTQGELAARLHFTDKAVSKWDRGESVPDIDVLCEAAAFFGVDLDYLVESHEKSEAKPAGCSRQEKRNKRLIIGMSVILVWLLASLVFFILSSVYEFRPVFLMCFLYAVPATIIVWIVLNSVWFHGAYNFIAVSLLMWAVLAAVYVSLLVFADRSLPLIFLPGVFGQLIIFLWSRIRTDSQRARLLEANRFSDREDA